MMYDGFRILAILNFILNPFGLFASINLLIASHLAESKYLVLYQLKMYAHIIDVILRWIFFALWLQEDTKRSRKNMRTMLIISFIIEFVTLDVSCLFTAYYAYEARRFAEFFD